VSLTSQSSSLINRLTLSFSLAQRFLNEVEEAEDGFDVVASMFSKGLFGQQQLGADKA
jgi:hypothetical protein